MSEDITDEQIEALEDEAAMVWDQEMIGLCQIALGGALGDPEGGYALSLDDDVRSRLRRMTQTQARAECARVIAGAQAQD